VVACGRVRSDSVDLDIKHQVLFAIYSEYQNDIPDMQKVNFRNLEIDSLAFKVALLKLQNEGLIDGLVTCPPGTRLAEKVKALLMEGVMPTREGIEYVERKLEVARDLSGREKLKLVSEKLGKLGYEILKEFVAAQFK